MTALRLPGRAAQGPASAAVRPTGRSGLRQGRVPPGAEESRRNTDQSLFLQGTGDWSFCCPLCRRLRRQGPYGLLMRSVGMSAWFKTRWRAPCVRIPILTGGNVRIGILTHSPAPPETGRNGTRPGFRLTEWEYGVEWMGFERRERSNVGSLQCSRGPMNFAEDLSMSRGRSWTAVIALVLVVAGCRDPKPAPTADHAGAGPRSRPSTQGSPPADPTPRRFARRTSASCSSATVTPRCTTYRVWSVG
jgi:hypothetical protein